MLDQPEEERIKSSIFALLGATAVLSGATRMTYSLAVVMLETSSNVDLFLPIIFTSFISYGIGSVLVNKSIYLSGLRIKNIPYFVKHIPKKNRNMSAWQLMSTHPVCFDFLPELTDISPQLQNTKFNGFPVLNGKR
jgi:H+/Cl- antiporter ClcA